MLAILIIIRSAAISPNSTYSMAFASVGAAMSYADEQIDCDVKIVGPDNVVYPRTNGVWAK